MENKNILKHDASLNYEIPPGVELPIVVIRAISGLRIFGDGSLDYTDPKVLAKPPETVGKPVFSAKSINIDSVYDGSFDYR